MPLVEIKDFHAFINNKLKNKQENYENFFEMSRNNDYAAERY